MFWKELRPGVFACLRASEGANVGLIRANGGWVLIDSAFCALELLEALDRKGIVLADLQLAFNTHFHADHTWGNQLLHCPILGHRDCRERMQVMAAEAWSAAGLASWLDEVEHSHPEQAERCRKRIADLRVTPPTEVFERERELVLDGSRLRFLHLGGHTPDLSVLWLPDEGVLFASDLLFEGRYPFILDGDLPVWIEALETLRKLGAEVIIPGHGNPCGEAELLRLRDYLSDTWERCADHFARGHELEAVLADDGFPRHGPEHAASLHEANIRHVYALQSRLSGDLGSGARA